MPITILCPLSKQAIKEPVIYKGYIYDKSSLKALVALKKAPTDLTDQSIRALPIDRFTQSLLEFSRENPGRDSIPVIAYDSTQAELEERSTEETILDEIYKDTYLYFPGNGVLCAVDGSLEEKSFIVDRRKTAVERGAPFNSATHGTPLSLQTDFLTHPVYQHLMNELKNAKEERKDTISLSDIFENFEQTGTERAVFSSELSTTPQKGKLDANSIYTLPYCIILAVIILLHISGDAIAALSGPFGAIIELATLLTLLFIRDTYLSIEKSLLPSIFLIGTSLLALAMLTGTFMSSSITGSLVFSLLNPFFFIPIALSLVITTVLLLKNTSFFDKDAEFNSNKTAAQIRLNGFISLAICLTLTAALSVGIFFTLGTISVPIAGFLYISLAIAIPAIFNTLYRNVYNFRCSDFVAQLLSGKINSNSFKQLLNVGIAFKAIFIIIICCITPFILPTLGALGTSIAAISAFLMAISSYGFLHNRIKLHEKKIEKVPPAQLDATPLVKLELRGEDLIALQGKISDSSTVATPRPIAAATEAASAAGAMAAGITPKPCGATDILADQQKNATVRFFRNTGEQEGASVPLLEEKASTAQEARNYGTRGR